jgi:hypothetical protein
MKKAEQNPAAGSKTATSDNELTPFDKPLALQAEGRRFEPVNSHTRSPERDFLRLMPRR